MSKDSLRFNGREVASSSQDSHRWFVCMLVALSRSKTGKRPTDYSVGNQLIAFISQHRPEELVTQAVASTCNKFGIMEDKLREILMIRIEQKLAGKFTNPSGRHRAIGKIFVRSVREELEEILGVRHY